MNRLDDPALARIARGDGAYERNLRLGNQCREAVLACRTLRLPTTYANPQHILVSGMGGSGIAADFLKALINEYGRIAMDTVRGYRLPAWASASTFLISCSHSGNTAEVMSVFDQGRANDCQMAVITTGGTLARLAKQSDVPVLEYSYFPEPRSAFGHTFVRLVSLALECGALDLPTSTLDHTARQLTGYESLLSVEVPFRNNPAKQIADFLFQRVPLVIGGAHLSAPARRWKTQFNENAEVFAEHDELPEAHHNTVVGLHLPEFIVGRLAVILLRDELSPKEIQERVSVTEVLLQKHHIDFRVIDVGGANLVESMLRAVLLGNMVSYYLALLYGVDPASISNIDFIKSSQTDAR